jgi:hypothetical protein
LYSERIVLIKHVILPIVKNKTIRVTHPIKTWGIMIDRAI